MNRGAALVLLGCGAVVAAAVVPPLAGPRRSTSGGSHAALSPSLSLAVRVDGDRSAALLAAPDGAHASARERGRSEHAADWSGDPSRGPRWTTEEERRAVGALGLARSIGWRDDDPRIERLAAWIAERPDPEAALRSREPGALARFDVEASRWRDALIDVAGLDGAARIAAVVDLHRIDGGTLEPVRVDLDEAPLPRESAFDLGD